MKVIKFLSIQIAPLFGTCMLLCGALITFLIASGGLLFLANEGRQKSFLVPVLLFLGIMVYWYRENKKTCAEKGCGTIGHKMTNTALYMVISILISILFMLYVFIPWWIPNYQGGPLLP